MILIGCISIIEKTTPKKAENQNYEMVDGATSITIYLLDRGRMWKIVREMTF